ncbi:MAG: VanZ family protein [Clostridia bacterium]|nr:VanZ family protein [Clostridia bacterium]
MAKFCRCILIFLIIINCTVIFSFSSQKSEKSSETSGRVIERIVETNPKTKNLSKAEKEKKKIELIGPVRKTAHFTVYTMLGTLLYLCAKTFEGKEKNKILISIILACLYACTDEIHQLFVSGRSGEIRDVLIDTTGATFGIVIVYVISKIRFKVKNR